MDSAQGRTMLDIFSDNILLTGEDFNLHLRNNVIKLQSLVHNQFAYPRYQNLFKYSWFKSGYLVNCTEKFDDPVRFSFGDSYGTHCEVEGSNSIAIVRCSWCKKLCLKHFLKTFSSVLLTIHNA